MIFNAKRRAEETVIALFLAVKKRREEESNRTTLRNFRITFAHIIRVPMRDLISSDAILSTPLSSVDRVLIRRTKYCDGTFIDASQPFIVQISIRRESGGVLNLTRENDAAEVNGGTNAV